MHSITATCASIQPVNYPGKETIFKSLQQLSPCNTAIMEDAKLWLGPGKGRKCRQVRCKTNAKKGVDVEDKNIASLNDVPDTVTRRGHVVRKPLQFWVNHSSYPKGQLPNKGKL